MARHLRLALGVEHTCFCAIQPAQRPAYVEGVADAWRPGGHLFAIFYLDPGNDSPDEGPPFEVSIAELDRLFLPRFTLEREWLPQRAYPGREGREWMRVMLKRKPGATESEIVAANLFAEPTLGSSETARPFETTNFIESPYQSSGQGSANKFAAT